jgi:hypothetical protein
LSLQVAVAAVVQILVVFQAVAAVAAEWSLQQALL